MLEFGNTGAKGRIDCHEEVKRFEEINEQGFIALFHLARDAGVFLAINSAAPTPKIADREQAEDDGVNVFKYEAFQSTSVVLASSE